VRIAALAALALVIATPAAQAAPRIPAFAHVIVVVFENKESEAVLGNRAAPVFNAYARRYARLLRYYAVTHPSLPNYLALVSGSTQGITSNCTECSVDATSLATTLEAAGRNWKTYAEGFPDGVRYVKRHNPFLYFRNVDRSRVVPLSELAADLRAQRLPDFSLIVPDLCNSMHDCPVFVGDAWLRQLAKPLVRLEKTAIFVLFDEGTSRLHGGGHIPALVLGTAVRPGARNGAFLTHYSVLRTIEDAWKLPRLGRSARTRPIVGIWR
jgi:phosphatidylinositol-3-phosphatase